MCLTPKGFTDKPVVLIARLAQLSSHRSTIQNHIGLIEGFASGLMFV